MSCRIVLCLSLLYLIPLTSVAQSRRFEILKNLELMDQVHEYLDLYYVDEPATGYISKVAIDEMLKKLDPYTVFYHESNMEDYRLMATGQYGGIGALIRKMKEYTCIVQPYENSPAFKSGLKAGDKILTIDGVSMVGKSSDDVSSFLKGPRGTTIEVEIDRPIAGLKTFKVTREEIKLPDLPYTGMLSNKIGYVKLSSFSQTAFNSVKQAFDELKGKGMETAILDLRDNGGGVLSQCLEIVNLFIPKGDTMLIAKGKDATWDKEYIASKKPLYEKLPIVILINERSASASEIVAGCLQDLDRGIVLGKTSFGKGLIQQNKKIAYNTQLKVTVAKYYTPSGRCIQKIDTEKKYSNNTDSLQSVFFTKNGRKVFGGGGIDPDVDIEDKETLPMLIALFQKNCIFKFGNQFFESINFPDSPKEFVLSDNDYNQFKQYLEDDNFPFSMYSEEVLKELQESLETESYFEDMKEEFTILEKSILNNKKQDLIRYEDEIREIISKDLILRQFYRSGMIEYSLKNDNFMAKALELLKNTDEYNNILSVK